MNYKPIDLANQGGLFGPESVALVGIADTVKFVDVFRDDINNNFILTQLKKFYLKLTLINVVRINLSDFQRITEYSLH